MRLLRIISVSLFLWGCANSNDSAVSVNAQGKHPEGWAAQHGTAYLQTDSNCRTCHGADLLGGISKKSCDRCHSVPHSVPWKEHYKATNQLVVCAACHGTGLMGGAKAPACKSCHVATPDGEVPQSGCTSCHFVPPNSSSFPNRSGAHQAHRALALGGCSACHSGGGYLTLNHGRQLTVAFLANYNAKSGPATRNIDGTCSNVSCHGGKTTQLWYGGRVDPLNDCDQCHRAGTALRVPENNSYYSGYHTKHISSVGLRCVDCHDMSVVDGVKSHFSNLSTAAFDLAPARTVKAPVNYVGGSCSPVSGAFPVSVCHGTRSWWQ